jgi:hypothetical protein
MLLSTTLAFDFWADAPQWNPGNDLPDVITLPTACCHRLVSQPRAGGRPAALELFPAEAGTLCHGRVCRRPDRGERSAADRKQAIAEKLARFTGLTPAYILRSNLRVNLGQFNRNLMDETGQTVGRLDTRFTGPSLDVLSREADYDPQSTAISSAYVSAFNDYARGKLGYGAGKAFKLFANVGDWDLKHTPPGAGYAVEGAANLLPDLAFTLKTNPTLRVLALVGTTTPRRPISKGASRCATCPCRTACARTFPTSITPAVTWSTHTRIC